MDKISEMKIRLSPQQQTYQGCFSLADTFKVMADEVTNNPAHVSYPRGRACYEILDYKIICFAPYDNHFCNAGRSGDVNRYLAKELMLYYAGRDDAEGFEDASKFWGKIKTPENKINSAYGYMVFVKKNKAGMTQLEWVKKSLINDKDSRQAIMFLGSPDYQYDGNLDFTCTLSYHFFIRDNMLNMIVNRRSQDLVLGFTYDSVWEMTLQQALLLELRQTYPDLKMGWISWNINSLHIYSENFEMVQKMLQNKFVSTPLPRMEKTPILSKFDESDPFQKWCIVESTKPKDV